MSSAAKFATLRVSDQWLLFKVFVVLASYKCLLLVVPFRHFFRTARTSPNTEIIPSEKNLTAIVWAIRVVSSRIPLGFTCLVQALSAKWLLKNYPDVGICIGVQKSPNQGFAAHAWVVYKGETILGEQANQIFEPILEWH